MKLLTAGIVLALGSVLSKSAPSSLEERVLKGENFTVEIPPGWIWSPTLLRGTSLICGASEQNGSASVNLVYGTPCLEPSILPFLWETRAKDAGAKVMSKHETTIDQEDFWEIVWNKVTTELDFLLVVAATLIIIYSLLFLLQPGNQRKPSRLLITLSEALGFTDISGKVRQSTKRFQQPSQVVVNITPPRRSIERNCLPLRQVREISGYAQRMARDGLYTIWKVRHGANTGKCGHVEEALPHPSKRKRLPRKGGILAFLLDRQVSCNPTGYDPLWSPSVSRQIRKYQ